MSKPNPFGTPAGATATATPPANGKAKTEAPDPFDATQVTRAGGSETIKAAPGAKNDPFAASSVSGVSGVQIQDYVGELLLICPTETGSMITAVSAQTGKPSEYVRADMIVLTGDEAGARHDDLLVFPQALVRALRKSLDASNSWTLGRLAMGNKKPGQNAPYILLEVPEGSEDEAIYLAWVEANRPK